MYEIWPPQPVEHKIPELHGGMVVRICKYDMLMGPCKRGFCINQNFSTHMENLTQDEKGQLIHEYRKIIKVWASLKDYLKDHPETFK